LHEFSIDLPDKRLKVRYIELVKSHMKTSTYTAAGIAVPADLKSSFATTQALWRFLGNDKVTLNKLIAPLRHFASQQLEESSPDYVLAVTDWSKLDYKKHKAKKDVVQVSHKEDIGYDLTTQLLVSAEHGQPLAPIQMHLKTADGFLSTSEIPPTEHTHHLEQVLPLMRDASAMGLSAKIVHVIDREADSVFHLREWNEQGFHYLVRAIDNRQVRWRESAVKLCHIKTQLESEGAFEQSREVMVGGKKGIQYVAETKIILDRPATRKINDRIVSIPGVPLSLRLVIVKVLDAKTNEELSAWYLLSNVSEEVSSERLALWYYWRWKIESYFKLMKSGGQQLEHWQQESALAILKRLLIASMACAAVWCLQESTDEESEELKAVLVRLSGKRLKRGRPPTAEILLSGLFVWLQMFDFWVSIDFDLTKVISTNSTLGKIMEKRKKHV
jgi:hypothetical protein